MNIFDACDSGNLTWLQRQKDAGTLPNLMQKNLGHWYPHELAARNGHLDVLRWLVQESGRQVDVTSDDNAAVKWAARNGHLHVVKWLVQESEQLVDVTADFDMALRRAASGGHLDVVKWLVKDYAEWLAVAELKHPRLCGLPVDVMAKDGLAFQWAARDGQLEILQWLIQDSNQAIDIEAFCDRAVAAAADNGHVAVASYLTSVASLVEAIGLEAFRGSLKKLSSAEKTVKKL